MDLIESAIIFTTRKMQGKTRKTNNTPAVLHSLEAGVIAASLTFDKEIVAAAILHDVIEDADVSENELYELFGERVTRLVLSETENKRRDIPPELSWKIRKEEAINVLKATSDEGVKIIFLSDKLSNIRSLAIDIEKYGDGVWQNFNQKNPKDHLWYYRSIADALEEYKSTFAWREYDALINKIFYLGDTN